MKVFLGGTVADSNWREEIIPLLEIDYFNPVVEEWDEQAYQTELYEREHCDYNLYVLTPKMIGYYSIAEVMDDAYKKGNRTIYCFLLQDGEDEFHEGQIISLEKIGRAITRYGSVWARSIKEVAGFLNYAATSEASDKSNEEIKQEVEFTASYNFLSKAVGNWKEKADRSQLWTGSLLREGLVHWKRLRALSNEKRSPIQSDMEEFVALSKEANRQIRRTNIFISYSRTPSKPLAHALYEHLKENYEVWFDQVSIPHGEDFEVAIEKGIRNCDNFLYIITNKSVTSTYCGDELNWAKAYGKRIIPIQHEKGVSEELIDSDISKINRILLDGISEEHWHVSEIISQIDEVCERQSDLVQQHTNLLTKAIEWKEDAYNPRLLSYQDNLTEIDRWRHDLRKANNKTNPVTALHEAFHSESLAFDQLNYREFWIAGRHPKVLEVIQASFTVNYDDTSEQPLNLLKSVYFLFVVSEETVGKELYLSQLSMARDHTIPVIFLCIDSADRTPLQIQESERVVDISEGVEPEVIQELKRDILLEIGHKYNYFKTPSTLSYQAHIWSKKNKPVTNLLRGRALSYFKYSQETYDILLSGNTAAYFEASKTVKEHTHYDLFICRSITKSNFSFWLSEQLLERGLTSWNHHDYLIEGQSEEEEVRQGIALSLNFVIVLSDAQLTPDIDDIQWQIEHARKLSKRIFLIRNDSTEIPDTLSEHDCIDFTTAPQQGTFQLIDTLTVDKEFVKFFNDLNPRVLQWADSHEKEKKDLLLSGFILEDAERRIEGHESDVEKIFTQFLVESRNQQKRLEKWNELKRMLIIALATFATLFGAWASYQSYEATTKSYDARLSNVEAKIGRIMAVEAQRETEIQRLEAEKQKRNAEYKTIQADSLAEAAICEKLKADASRQFAENEQKKADKAREYSDQLKRTARKETRRSKALINAYEVRNTETKLINDQSLAKAVQAYYLFENDKGEVKYQPDIFTSLFKATLGNSAKSQKIIRDLDPTAGLTSYRPYAFTYDKRSQVFFIFKTNGYDTRISKRTLRNPVGQILIKNHRRMIPALSEITDRVWVISNQGLGEINAGDDKYAIRDSTDTNSKKIMVAAVGDATEIIATRSATSLRLYLATVEQVHKIFELPEPGNNPFPEAFTLKSIAGGYLLSLARGDSIMTYQVSGAVPPNPRNYKRKKVASSSGTTEQISSVDIKNFKLALGTASGKIAIDDWLGRSEIQAVERAKSSIRKIVLDDSEHFYAATTFGNQFENSGIILNTLLREEDPAGSTVIGHLERSSDDIISDIAIIDGQLFYIENARAIKYHTLAARDIIKTSCSLLDNCGEEKTRFIQEYQAEITEELIRADELKFCKCE